MDDDLQALNYANELQHQRECELLAADPGYFEFINTVENEVAKVSDMIQSKFLRKEDFDEDQVCTIADVKLEPIMNNETKWVLYFKEHPKGMVLNTTTIRVLEAAFGEDSDDWRGKRVKVYNDPNVSFQGRVVGGIRLRTPSKASAQPAPAPKPAPADDFDDDVPF